MTDQLLVIPLTTAIPFLAGPDSVHRFAMSPLPDLRGASRAIRADLSVLYRLSLPTEVDGRPGSLTIRYRTDTELAVLPDGAHVERVAAPGRLEPGQRLTVRVVAEKRHEDAAGRTVTRHVRDEEADSWARALMQRHGITADAVEVTSRWTFGVPRSAARASQASRPAHGAQGSRPTSFTLRDVTVTVAEVALECDALTRGIGRGKAYGYGLPLIL